MRRLLLAALWLAVIGTLAELLLLEHYEGRWQPVPLFLLGATLIVLLGRLLWPGRASVRALGVCMLALIVAGLVGTFLHYDGNVEFELEMYADRRGWELVWESLRGATPVLSPGTLCQIGLVGLAYVYRHPAAARS